MNGAIEAVVDAHADRMIRHLAVKIDATTEQQEKLHSIVHAAVKDLSARSCAPGEGASPRV